MKKKCKNNNFRWALRRAVSAVLTAVLTLAPAGGVNAGVEELTYYTDGSKAYYNPLTNGYYGYMNVQYPNLATGEMISGCLPVLVKDGHTLVDFQDISGMLNISYEWNDGNPKMQVFRREIQFTKDSAKVVYSFSDKEIKLQMHTAAVYQDARLWVPFEWYLLLADVGYNMIVEENGTVYAEMQEPKETILDVIIGIYEDTRIFEYESDFNLSEEVLSQRDLGSKIVDIADGIMRLEWDKWLSVFPNILDEAYAKDVMELIVAGSPDEALEILQEKEAFSDGTKQMISLFGDNITGMVGTGMVQFGMYLQECADQEIGKRLKEYAEGSESWKAMRNALQDRTMNAYLFKDAGSNLIYSSKGKELILNGNEVKINGKAIKVTAADQATALIDLVTYAVDAVSSVKSFENRDQYVIQGARAMLERLETQESVLSEHCIDAFDEVVSKYESEMGLAVNWFLENAEKLVMNTAEGVALALADTVASPFAIYKMGCAAGDWIAEKLGKETFSTKLNGTEAFQLSLIAMQYQQDAYAMYRLFYQDWIDSFDSTYGFDEEKTEDMLCQAYHYLKTCYVTRGLALDSAWQHSDTPAYQKQRNLQEEELEQQCMILNYDEEELLPTEKLWLVQQSEYSDEHLALYVTPAYLHISGSVYDIGEEAPVTTAGIKIYDAQDTLLTAALVDESGAFDLYLPIEIQEELMSSWNPTIAYPEKLTLTCTPKDGDEVSVEVPVGKVTELNELSAMKTVRELTADVGVIEVGEVLHPYYRFIKEVLLPEMGMADLSVMEKDVTMETFRESWYWNKRPGLLGADIADMNADGVEDLLVYYYGTAPAIYRILEKTDDSGGYYYGAYTDSYMTEERDNCLLASVYSMNENGEIYPVLEEPAVLDEGCGTNYEYIGGGILELDGKKYLYTECYSRGLFADGFGLGYYFYEVRGTELIPAWYICKSDGGSSGIAFSLFTIDEEKNARKYILFGEEGFQFDSGVPVYSNDWANVRGAFDHGFTLIGMPKSACDMEGMTNYPSYFQEEYLKPSFKALCDGEGNSGTRSMKSEVWDYTNLRDYIKVDQEGANGNEKE